MQQKTVQIAPNMLDYSIKLVRLFTVTTEELARLLRYQLDASGRTVYQLHMTMTNRVSHQTVYNALAGKPIKSDTMLALLDELGLKIVPTGKAKVTK